jgi:hypothetical protein
MSNVKEENLKQQQEGEQPRDTKQANGVNEGSEAKVVAWPNSAVRDATMSDANSRQPAVQQHSGASIPIRSKNSLAAKKRKKAAHRRRLRASSANG